MVSTNSGFTLPQIAIDNLNLQDRREFVIKPIEDYMLNQGSPLIKSVNNVTGDGWDMDSIIGPDVVIQPGYNADFTPMGETNIESKRLTVDPFKVNVKWSREQFYGTILEKLGGRELNRAWLESSEGGRAIMGAVMSVMMKGITRNIFDIFLWGNKDINLADLSCTPSNTKVTATEMAARAFDMLKTTEGLFSRLKGNAGCLVGQLGHNESALPDGYAVTAFEMVRDKEGRALEYADENSIAYVCSGSIYKNYKRHLQSVGATDGNFRTLTNGVDVPLFENIPVYPINSFHHIDKKYFNKSNRHFVGLGLMDTICVGSDIEAADANPMFAVGPYPEPNEEQTWGKSRFKLGVNFAYPEWLNWALSWEAAN